MPYQSLFPSETVDTIIIITIIIIIITTTIIIIIIIITQRKENVGHFDGIVGCRNVD